MAAALAHRHGGPLIANSHCHGPTGLGVLGSEVPSTGTHGPGFLYPSLALPADANKEIRGVIITQPVGLKSFDVQPTSAFTAEANTGVQSAFFDFQVYVDGTLLNSNPNGLGTGVARATLTFTGDATLQGAIGAVIVNTLVAGGMAGNVVSVVGDYTVIASQYDRVSHLLEQIAPEACFFQPFLVDSASVPMAPADINKMRYYAKLEALNMTGAGILPVVVTGLPVDADYKAWGSTDDLRVQFNAETVGEDSAKMLVLDLALPFSGTFNEAGQMEPADGLSNGADLPNDAGYDALATHAVVTLQTLQSMV